MAKVVALCGMICSGKSTYARQLRDELPAVVLSCDELTLGLFDGNLGDRHDEMLDRIYAYLLNKAAEIVRAGANVVLDFGFWRRTFREDTRRFFREVNIPAEWHYLEVDDFTWRRNIAFRNNAVLQGTDTSYFVDEGLAEKCLLLFEAPEDGEMDVLPTRS